MLTKDQIKRYSRHLILPEVGVEGQKKLLEGKVLLIGAGGLGAPLALYLTAAGVGTMGIVDFDSVDFSNLQRQVIFTAADVGRKKVEVAKERMEAMNPEVKVIPYEEKLSSENALEIFSEYDIVIDGTDNFPTRYLVNDACVLQKIPNVHGSIFRFEGQATVFWPERGPCYRCLYPEPPPPGMVPSCAEGGVLGILPGLVGLIQATEAVKILLGKGETLAGRLLRFDAMGMRFEEFALRRDPHCPICGEAPTIHELQDYEAFCGLQRGEESPAAEDPEQQDPLLNCSPEEAEKRMTENGRILLLDVREPYEFDICHLPDAKLIPLGELAERYQELAKEEEILCYCRTGRRSLKATRFLRSKGFEKVKNIRGGIHGWADAIDPSLPKY